MNKEYTSDSFNFKTLYKKVIDSLPENEKLSMYEAISNYALAGEEPQSLSPSCNIMWPLVKDYINSPNVSSVEDTSVPKEKPLRSSSVIYQSHFHVLRGLSDIECGKCIKLLYDYIFFGIEPKLIDSNPAFVSVWPIIRVSLENAHKKYDKCVANGEKGGKFGRLGGRPRKDQAPKDEIEPSMRENPNKTPREKPQEKPYSVSDSVNVSYLSYNIETNKETYITTATKSESVCLKTTDSDKTDSAGADAPGKQAPTKTQVAAYFKKKGIATPKEEAEKFISYNASRNWAYLKQRTWSELADMWCAHKQQLAASQGTGDTSAQTGKRETPQTTQTKEPDKSAKANKDNDNYDPDVPRVDGRTFEQFDAWLNKERQDWWHDGVLRHIPQMRLTLFRKFSNRDYFNQFCHFGISFEVYLRREQQAREEEEKELEEKRKLAENPPF